MACSVRLPATRSASSVVCSHRRAARTPSRRGKLISSLTIGVGITPCMKIEPRPASLHGAFGIWLRG